ncbi:uncharacterized protein LOC109850319 [Asparagus officinalis]|uniref:uncharacterized protein LOC109850319 n=1 Tax=Asparagus officinalis TaxID=4686 RepID=UPI00098E86A9|nr:uncharacterized protein LOC109850319 [Asparagus officinalis]
MAFYNNMGDKITDGEGIASELISFFKNLMGTTVFTNAPDVDIIQIGPCLSEEQASCISCPVSKEEIKKPVFSMSDNNASGPDGYSVAFYKSSWEIVGDEVTLAIEEFFKTGKLLGAVNSTSITLIPMVQCPQNPSKFRSISCCNSIYKFISKILAKILQSVMGAIISEAQSAFVKGRKISSNILLAHELAKNYGRKHLSPRAMINIDIKKAFDSIS